MTGANKQPNLWHDHSTCSSHLQPLLVSCCANEPLMPDNQHHT